MKIDCEAVAHSTIDGHIEQLALGGDPTDALDALRALGAGALPSIRAGLGDGRHEVRRWCTYLWAESEPNGVDALIPLMRDPKSQVRFMAVVCISRANPEVVEKWGIVPRLMELAWHDESVRVRRQAVLQLGFEYAGSQLEGFFEELLDNERDPKVHRNAGIGLFLSRQRTREERTC